MGPLMVRQVYLSFPSASDNTCTVTLTEALPWEESVNKRYSVYCVLRIKYKTRFTFKFRAFSRRFYPKRLTIRTFVRRKRNNNTSLLV